MQTTRDAQHALEFRGATIHRWLSHLNANTPISTNQPSLDLPFQRWFKFKEAFSPTLVIDLIKGAKQVPRTCLDPFGGCGTTGLTCQFAGIRPTLIEVNPFIADLAEAKLATYDIEALQNDYLSVRKEVRRKSNVDPLEIMDGAPTTFCEPGDNERWVFSRKVLTRILSYRVAIESLNVRKHKRLFRVILGSLLIECSNVIVNGKGRRYREGWKKRDVTPEKVDFNFEAAFLAALADIQQFSRRATKQYTVLRGSCLEKLDEAETVDISIFSPPYPNSFDYTDIYNLELWVLGYLKTKPDNTKLREETLRSHVQVRIPARGKAISTPTLDSVVDQLVTRRDKLWDSRIPDMVTGYFSDLTQVLLQLRKKVKRGGTIAMVVGDSRYDSVRVPVAKILTEIGDDLGYSLLESKTLRSMRASAQQGGAFTLDETLVQFMR